MVNCLNRYQTAEFLTMNHPEILKQCENGGIVVSGLLFEFLGADDKPVRAGGVDAHIEKWNVTEMKGYFNQFLFGGGAKMTFQMNREDFNKVWVRFHGA